MLYGLDPGSGYSLRDYRRNSRYDTITTVRKHNLISGVHKERNRRTSSDRRDRARVSVDGPNQLVTWLGCASHFDRNLLASIINLRVPSCPLPLHPPSISGTVSSALVPPRLVTPRFAHQALLTKRNAGVYKRSSLEFDLFKNLGGT